MQEIKRNKNARNQKKAKRKVNPNQKREETVAVARVRERI